MMVFWRALISSGVPHLWFVSGVNLYGVIICVECVPTLAGKKLLDLIPIIKNQPLKKKRIRPRIGFSILFICETGILHGTNQTIQQQVLGFVVPFASLSILWKNPGPKPFL
jgi:hypothetical protein